MRHQYGAPGAGVVPCPASTSLSAVLFRKIQKGVCLKKISKKQKKSVDKIYLVVLLLQQKGCANYESNGDIDEDYGRKGVHKRSTWKEDRLLR